MLKLQARMCLPQSGDFQYALARAFLLPGLKSLLPSVKKLFRGVPLSEHEIYEHIQESLLLGKKTKGNLAWCFHSFLLVIEWGFLQKFSYFDRKEWQIKAG